MRPQVGNDQWPSRRRQQHGRKPFAPRRKTNGLISVTEVLRRGLHHTHPGDNSRKYPEWDGAQSKLSGRAASCIDVAALTPEARKSPMTRTLRFPSPRPSKIAKSGDKHMASAMDDVKITGGVDQPASNSPLVPHPTPPTCHHILRSAKSIRAGNGLGVSRCNPPGPFRQLSLGRFPTCPQCPRRGNIPAMGAPRAISSKMDLSM